MSHWQPIVSRIANGEISAECYSAELEIPFKSSSDQEARQIVPLTQAEFLDDGGPLFLTFIPEKLTYYACAYQQFHSPIQLYLIDKQNDKRVLVEEFSTFLIPNIQTEEEGIRFVSLNSRLEGLVTPLTGDEKPPLESNHQRYVAFESLSGRRQIGIVGSLSKVIIKLKY